jgi:PAS domain S-box-containing protein
VQVAYWNFAEFMYRNAETFRLANFWVKAHVFAGSWAAPLLLYFTLVFTEKKNLIKNPLTYVLLFLPPLYTTYLFSFTNLAIMPPIFIEPFGWVYATENNVFYIGSITLYFTEATAALVLFMHKYFTTKKPLKKNQARLIAIGFLAPVAGGLLTAVILPILNIETPFITTNLFLWLVIFMGYAISKYELFAINPERAAKNIISSMADSLILMDPKENILSVNKSTLNLLGYTEGEVLGKPVAMLFADKSILSYFASQGWMVKNYETRYITKTKKTLPVLLSTSVIKDQLGGVAGIVSVANDLTERVIANTLQEALLQVPREIKEIDFGYLYRSATEAARVGGDFYDLFELEDNKICIVVGDISGKGLQAANLTSLVKNTIRAYAFLGESPASVIGRTNNVIKKASAPKTFVTVFFGALDITTGKLTYCSAGHPIALLKRGASVSRLQNNSTVIGVFQDQVYFNDEVYLDFEDVLILYTDGITEARRNSDLFGEERLVSLIEGLKYESPKDLPDGIFSKVLDYSKGILVDDAVILAVSRKTEK